MPQTTKGGASNAWEGEHGPEVISFPVSDVNISELSKPELKQRLAEAGLPVSGTKADLVARLSEV